MSSITTTTAVCRLGHPWSARRGLKTRTAASPCLRPAASDRTASTTDSRTPSSRSISSV